MKTEPTEACKMIEESWYAIPYMGVDYPQDPDIVIDKEDVYEIAKKAFQEGQSNPKIKQLEWEKSLFFEGDFEAKCSLGLNDYKYYINLKDDYATLSLRSNSQIIVLGPYSRPNEAKAAAQADFEQRVKECLE